MTVCQSGQLTGFGTKCENVFTFDLSTQYPTLAANSQNSANFKFLDVEEYVSTVFDAMQTALPYRAPLQGVLRGWHAACALPTSSQIGRIACYH